jgi:hypothetical protein
MYQYNVPSRLKINIKIKVSYIDATIGF